MTGERLERARAMGRLDGETDGWGGERQRERDVERDGVRLVRKKSVYPVSKWRKREMNTGGTFRPVQ